MDTEVLKDQICTAFETEIKRAQMGTHGMLSLLTQLRVSLRRIEDGDLSEEGAA